MKKRKLYLEERLHLLKKMLNEHTIKFQVELPTSELQKQFHNFILECIGIIEGDNPS
jgi:hypothetical protein